MEILRQFTPAETYLIQYHRKAQLKKMLQLTLADLTFKKILRIETVEEQNNENDPAITRRYLSIGEEHHHYKARPHEIPFLEAFFKEPELELLFKDLVKIAYKKAQSRSRYFYRMFLANETLSPLFEQGFWKKFWGSIALTTKGRSVSEEVLAVIRRLEKELPEAMENDKARALEILKTIGGNVFLLQGIDFEVLRTIDEEFAKKFSDDQRQEDGDFMAAAAWFLFWGEDDAAEFDSAFDSADGAGGDSGFGGDAGCSGCSGCGGCGGCGG